MPKISPLSSDTERRLSSALDKVASLVDAGDSPDDAIIKVAGDGHFLPGHVDLIIHAFNTGRSLAHVDHAHQEEKGASITLANRDVITKKLNTESQKTASQKFHDTQVAREYNAPPTWLANREKAARVKDLQAKFAARLPEPIRLCGDPEVVMRKIMSKRASLQRSHDELQTAHRDSQYKAAQAVEALESYFRVPGGLPFAAVRQKAAMLFGSEANKLFGLLEQRNPRFVKQASLQQHAVDLNQQPYTLIKACLETKRTYKQAKQAAEASQPPVPIKHYEPPLLTSILPEEKEASLGAGIFGGLMASGAQNAKNHILPDTNQLVQRAQQGLADPGHEAKLRGIRAQAILHDALFSDPVIRGYQPNEIIDAYNDLSQLAPAAASSSMIMQPALRRMLSQGGLESMEIDQLLGTEQKLRSRQSPLIPNLTMPQSMQQPTNKLL
jgi:hypothetical protein